MENNEFKFCPKCGHEQRPGAVFCPQCLTKLTAEEEKKETPEVKKTTPTKNNGNTATLNALNKLGTSASQSNGNVPTFLLAAAVCALISAICLITFFSSFMEYSYYINYDYPDPFENAPTICTLFCYIIGILGSFALIAALFTKKKEAIAITLFVIAGSYFLELMSWVTYILYEHINFDYSDPFYYIRMAFPIFLKFAVFAFLGIACLKKIDIRKIGLAFIGAAALAFFILLIRYAIWEALTFGYFLYWLADCGIVVMITLVLGNSAPAAAPAHTGATTNTSQATPNTQATPQKAPTPQGEPNITLPPEGKNDVALVVILSIVTCGIYFFYWVYKISVFSSKALGREQFSPGVQVVLSLFIPFYYLYWIYSHSKNISEIAVRRNMHTDDMSVINLILGLFGLWVVAAGLMQNQINKIYEVPIQNIVATAPKPEPKAAAPATTATQATPDPTTVNNIHTYPTPDAPQQTTTDISVKAEELKQVKELLDTGCITLAEFQKMKEEILNK